MLNSLIFHLYLCYSRCFHFLIFLVPVHFTLRWIIIWFDCLMSATILDFGTVSETFSVSVCLHHALFLCFLFHHVIYRSLSAVHSVFSAYLKCQASSPCTNMTTRDRECSVGELFFYRVVVFTLYLMEHEGLQTWNGKPLGTDSGNEWRLQERSGWSDVGGETIDLSLWDLPDRIGAPRGSYTVHSLLLLVFLWPCGIWKAQIGEKKCFLCYFL